MWEVPITARKVAESSQLVRIDKKALGRFARELARDRPEIPQWNVDYHYCAHNEATVSYLLLLDSLNFCFWPPQGKAKWEVQYKSIRLSGYYALSASLKRAAEKGIPVLRADYLADLTMDGLKRILKGRGELQLLEKRLHILHELGWVLMRDFEGRAHRMVETVDNSAVRLVRLVAERLPSFRDTSLFMGDQVYFYKRAQILAADLFAAFKGEKWGRFKDMHVLTAFADYKVPQVLRHLGILVYCPELAERVDGKVLLASGSPEEVEIRANTIWAVELLQSKLAEMGERLMAVEIDWILWNLGQLKKFKKRPYHRTVTIFY